MPNSLSIRMNNAKTLEESSKAEVRDHTPKSHTHTESNITDLDHNAQSVKGVAINDAAKADQKVLGYDSATDRIVYITPAPSGGLLKTGQTVSYHADDDGDLELGIAHDYTVLDTGDYTGTTNIVINGKTHALSNECVQDNVTGKTWARYVPNADIGPDNNGKLFWYDSTNAEDIWSFVAQANANSLGGHTDWRIPNNHELWSISDLSKASVIIDTTVFPSTPVGEHWSSSTFLIATDYAYSVPFSSGLHYYGQKTTEKQYVRLVRG